MFRMSRESGGVKVKTREFSGFCHQMTCVNNTLKPMLFFVIAGQLLAADEELYPKKIRNTFCDNIFVLL